MKHIKRFNENTDLKSRIDALSTRHQEIMDEMNEPEFKLKSDIIKALGDYTETGDPEDAKRIAIDIINTYL